MWALTVACASLVLRAKTGSGDGKVEGRFGKREEPRGQEDKKKQTDSVGDTTASNEATRPAGRKERHYPRVEKTVGNVLIKLLEISTKVIQNRVHGLTNGDDIAPWTHFSCASTFLRLSSVSRI